MKVSIEDKFKGKGKRKCRICGNARGLIRKYNLYTCRRCFREIAYDIGFKKFGG
ncbi:30S ribosomal protein S14 [Candidatus Micrarchaeota archaeon]|nr:30S ribosomal protein S14 [Candidatus Micrarchaeota archaeon]